MCNLKSRSQVDKYLLSWVKSWNTFHSYPKNNKDLIKNFRASNNLISNSPALWLLIKEHLVPISDAYDGINVLFFLIGIDRQWFPKAE